ncbi:MAG: hypothetical protein RMN25_09400 [Anaerolineae bacterium]|nr:hypothetical protein [Thermoflexales bacterium]MDW8407985.1 hypothetical protein [Anaerolineae bacterium]
MLLIHSVVRWAVVVLGVAVLARLLTGWLQRRDFTQLDDKLSRWFTIAFDVQTLIGITYLLWSGIADGNWSRYRLEHAFLMLVALGVVHMSMRWRKAADLLRFRNTFLSFAAGLAIVIVGVALLPGGWARPFPPAFGLP